MIRSEGDVVSWMEVFGQNNSVKNRILSELVDELDNLG